MMKKKWIACLTALVLALGLGLTACKDPAESGGTGGGQTGGNTTDKTYFESQQVFYLDLTMSSLIGRLDELVNAPGTLTFETDGKAKMNVTFNEWAHSLMEEHDLFIDAFTHDDTYELNEDRTQLTYHSTRESLSAAPMVAELETLDNDSLRFVLDIHNAIPNTKLTFYNDTDMLPPLVEYDVTLTPGDGVDGVVIETTCGENRQFTLPENTFVNGTKDFVGWSDGTKIYKPGDKYTVTADVTFTAVWGDFYTLTFAGGEGATGTAPTMAKQQAGTEITLPENPFTNGKKVFNGWKTGYKTYKAGDKYTVTADATFTAQWLNKVTITFAGGEGAVGEAPAALVDQVEKSKITLPENPFTNGDKIFAGWKKATSSTVYKAGTNFTVPAEDLTLTAVWHNPVDISFAGGDGATGETATIQDAEETTKIALPENGFTKTGYVFAGWSDGEKTYQAGDKITVPAANVTYTAVWNKLVTLSFVGGDGATGSVDAIENAEQTKKVLLPENGFAKEGKEFGGWSDGTKTYQPHDSYTVTDQNATFTAVWVNGQFAPYRVIFRSEQAVPVKADVDVKLDALMAMTEIIINPDMTADYRIKFKADADLTDNATKLGIEIAAMRALEVEYLGVPYTCDKSAKTITLDIGEGKTVVFTYTQTAKNVDAGVLYNRLETEVPFALGDLTTLKFTALDEKPSYLSEAKYFTGKYSFFTVKMWLYPDGTGELNAAIIKLPVFHQFNADKTALIWLGDSGGSLAGAVRTENGKMIVAISMAGTSIEMTETAA